MSESVNGERKVKVRSGPRRLRNRSVKLLTKQAMTVLSRDLDRLLDISFNCALDKIDSGKLIDYLKLLNDFKKMQAKEPDHKDTVSIKELERIAAKADESV